MNIDDFSRRRFIGGTAAATAALGFPSVLRAAEDTKQLKIGLIGCGGRGTGAAEQALLADPNTVLWSVGDAFEVANQRTLGFLKKYEDRSNVPEERQFSGLDAFQKVIDSGVDVVLLAAPPGFRPEHLRAAIDAGVHVFAEKPMATDVQGVKSVMASAKLAKEKNVAIQHGFCWRFAPGVRVLYDKIQSGEYGRIISVYGTYMGHVSKGLPADMKKPADMSEMEWEIRWWTNYEWLAGGPLLEQAIHTVDKVSWAMGDVPPVAAVANGGRAWRTDVGNVYDHYNVDYEYPDGIFCHVGERQYPQLHAEVVDRIFCEKGTGIGPDRPLFKGPDGKIAWMYRPEEGEEQNMYQVCHNEFFAALRRGEIINTGEYMANATMLGLMGKEAAHTGKRITWEQMWASDQRLVPEKITMDGEMEPRPVPVPGKHQLS